MIDDTSLPHISHLSRGLHKLEQAYPNWRGEVPDIEECIDTQEAEINDLVKICKDYYELVVRMSAAAMGEYGPYKRGRVEDIEDLRTRMETAEATLDSMSDYTEAAKADLRDRVAELEEKRDNQKARADRNERHAVRAEEELEAYRWLHNRDRYEVVRIVSGQWHVYDISDGWQRQIGRTFKSVIKAIHVAQADQRKRELS